MQSCALEQLPAHHINKQTNKQTLQKYSDECQPRVKTSLFDRVEKADRQRGLTY